MNSASRATAVVLATTAGLLTAVTATPASATTTCTSPVHKRQIFANTTFSGTPKKTACDAAINENWGTGAPASGLPANNFGVRWTVTRDFGSGGPFTFTAAAQDGIRVYVDGVRKIDLWRNVSSTVSKTLNLTLPSGRHTLRIDYANWTGKANVKFTYAPRTSATVDKVRPLTPTGLKAAYDTVTGRAKLTWAANKEMDLAGYRVYRRPADGSTWRALTTTAAVSLTDTPPMTGGVYQYQVRAYDKAGNESAGTAAQSVTTVDRTGPERVTGLTGLGTTAGNSLTWQASSSPDVHHYEVWGAPEGQGDPDGPETVFGTSFTDVIAEAGVPYWYEIQAVDGAQNLSPVSTIVTVTRPVASTAPAPAAVQGTPADASTTLTWTPAEGTGADGFRVYRRTAHTGAWSLLGSASTASYEDTSAPQGKAYYYVVAVDADGGESAPSGEAVVERLSPATATGPAAPQLTVVSEGGTRFPITVGVKPGAGDENRVLKGYSWDISGACGSSGTQLTTTDTVSWTPPYNGPCTVTVRAVDAYGRVGEQSASVEVMVNR
jgi:fibronectin type 3 domain-containing protein